MEVKEDALKYDRERGTVEILVVEDSLTQGVQIQNLLEREGGYSVTLAKSGAEALSLLEKFLPDLVVSDIVMPEMDGFTLCREIKSQERLNHVPVLLLSGLSGPDDIIKGLESGADNFVTKPYDDGALLSRVEHILVNQRLRKTASPERELEVFFSNRKITINADRLQIIDLLLATYESALRQKEELERTRRDLSEANQTIRTLSGILPICAKCKKIRDDGGEWQAIESYVSQRSEAEFSHGLCDDCVKELYPDLDD